ncbi:hypothetical protein C7974DRAFT_62737 [Boeremia exigua]|uniref:uncharacterized protein n=1 Tax=Boeremia exigua TaxID=749465 RepID=UPI001E8EF260|nr:uncharacterized protein C7974DRAFT_62737 [Boeremia exigua]KAH6615302.1 hypothetical protein C7974DRAFT_62737 [Boeremia exigua]
MSYRPSCWTAGSEIPEIEGPDDRDMECDFDTTMIDQDQNETQLESRHHFDISSSSDTVDQADHAHSIRSGLGLHSETTTFPDQVSRDTFGLGAHSMEQASPCFEESEGPAIRANDLAHSSVDGCEWNQPWRVYQQDTVSDDHIDPCLLETSVDSMLPRGTRQYHDLPIIEPRFVPGGDDGAFWDAGIMGQSQWQASTSLPLENPEDQYAAAFPYSNISAPPARMLDAHSSEMQEIVSERMHTPTQRHVSTEGATASNRRYCYSSSSAPGPTVSSGTSPPSNFMAIPGQDVPSASIWKYQTQRTSTSGAAGRDQIHLQVPRDPQHCYHLKTTNSVSGIVDVDESHQGAAMRRSSSSHLSVPDNIMQRYNAPSPTISDMSTSSSMVPDDLICRIEGCQVRFTGRYRKGNLRRHERLVHNETKYLCGVGDCDKSFNRKDARLKHYHTRASLMWHQSAGRHNMPHRLVTLLSICYWASLLFLCCVSKLVPHCAR